MKSTKFLPVIVVLASMLLSACSGLGSPLAAPAAVITTGQSVSLPLTSAPVLANPQAATDVASIQSAYEAVYQSVNPSVVTIMISSQVSGQGNGQNSQGQVVPTAQGSGFVWDTAGHIVTNNHVIAGAARISVTFSDGSSYDAKLVGADPNSDLAVIQVTGAPASLLQPISVGDSTQVKVGQLVVAIGNPFGLSNTMTTGIVSGIGRSIQAGVNNSQNGASSAPSFSIPDVIQTDAAINPGNSGGVLVDMSGTLIGVPSQIESASGSNSGVGFAIPSALVSRVVPQLISTGAAAHSYLGFSGGTITTDIVSSLNLKAGQQGILVATVVAGGPADKAGLQGAIVDANGNPTAAGDIITGIDGKSITTFEDLISYLSSSTQPDQLVTLNVLRAGKDIQMKVTLGTQPTN
jgi:S1-C subfamily serine protease